MNRSILIVICDFLLLSLLTFSTDFSKVASESAPPTAKPEAATNQLDSGKDLAAVMKLALDDEQKRRALLLQELESTRTSAEERQKQLQATEQQRADLQQQFTRAQSSIADLNQQVRASATDATISKEKLAAMEAELQKRAAEANAMQQQLTSLSQSNQAALSEKQQLATKLQVAEVEKKFATEQVVAMKEQVKVEREEKSKLADSVKSLATNSTQLVQEIRENRPLTPNTIFDEFTASRVRANFAAFRSGLFDTNKRKETATILVSDGTNTFAVCHVEDTPLTFWVPGTQWESLTGNLNRGGGQVAIQSLSFHLQDPRIVFMPISSSEARQLPGKVYRLSNSPFKFQDAVLVGAGEGYYGECKFEIDPNLPTYVKLDRNLVKGLFGKFNPSRGDLVFSKTGEVLGIMANSTYCLLLRNFEPSATFDFGPDVRAQKTGDTLAALYSVIQQFPTKLQ